MTPISRRYFLNDCGIGLGKIAAAGLLTESLTGRATAASLTNALTPKQPHFPGKTKAVIHLFMAGALSQLEMFDPKPMLSKLEGKPLPKSVIGDQRYAFINSNSSMMASPFTFKKYGESGAELSEMLPHLAKVVDDIAIIKSVHTDQFNHAPAQILFNTGSPRPGRPSMGSWVNYGLGSEAEDLPGFVVLNSSGGISGGASNWSCGFMPTVYQGVPFRGQGDPILNLANPKGIDATLQRESLDLLSTLNQQQLADVGDPEDVGGTARMEYQITGDTGSSPNWYYWDTAGATNKWSIAPVGTQYPLYTSERTELDTNIRSFYDTLPAYFEQGGFFRYIGTE